MTLYCSGTLEHGKHKTTIMKYLDKSEYGLRFVCPNPQCNKVVVTPYNLPPWIKRKKKLVVQPKSFLSWKWVTKR